MEMSEKATVVQLFKEGKITEYVLQQELTKIVGYMSEVHISESSSANTASTFGIFIYPEKCVNGIKTIYLIDKAVIFNNFFTAEEIVERLDKLSKYRESIVKEFFKFDSKTKDDALTLSEVLAFYLRIYSSMLSVLSVRGKDFLPDEEKLLNIVIELEDGKNLSENIEFLSVNNIMPKEISEVASKLVHDIPEAEMEGKIKFVTDGAELPAFNVGQQEIRDLCSGTFGTRAHKEIRYDYLPSTNQ